MQRFNTRTGFLTTLLIPGIVATATLPAAGQISVDTDFEGGSARVLEIDQERHLIRIMPGGDPERGWPAWWCFRVTGLNKGQSFEVRVTGATSVLPAGRPGAGKPLSASWAMPTQAVWSTDGRNWQQTPAGTRDNSQMPYQLTAAAAEMWIAWGPLATPSVVAEWIEDAARQSASAQAFELATSRAGLPVRGLHVTTAADSEQQRPVIWFQARQHAWESGASWVAKGIIDWLISDDPDAAWLREHADIYVVPIMDVDRTASGDGGKESVPHDHNRDWSDTPHYPEVAAVQKRVRQWIDQNRMDVFIDLHNPGASDKYAFFFVAPDEVMTESSKAHRAQFLDSVDSAWHSPIPLHRKTRTTGPSYHPLWNRISTNWVSSQAADNTVSVCLETGWNTPHSTTHGYQQTGASLATGTARFLRETQKSN